MITSLIEFVAVVAIFLLAGAAVSFLFFGYLAYLDDFRDMPHEEDAHKD